MFLDYLYNLVLIIVSTFLFGFLYEKINKKNTSFIMKNFGWIGFCIIASIGTIIHELSHLLACLLFLHVPTKIELFRPIKGKEDGVLGLVEHRYLKTKYRKAGNFLIGAAPMVFGSLIIIFLLKLLGFNNLNNITDIIKSLSLINFNSIFSYIILFLIVSISISMNMSRQDMKNSLFGIFSMISMFLIIYFVLKYFLPLDIFLIFINYFNTLTKSYIYILIIGFIISLLICIIGSIINVFKRI